MENLVLHNNPFYHGSEKANSNPLSHLQKVVTNLSIRRISKNSIELNRTPKKIQTTQSLPFNSMMALLVRMNLFDKFSTCALPTAHFLFEVFTEYEFVCGYQRLDHIDLTTEKFLKC